MKSEWIEGSAALLYQLRGLASGRTAMMQTVRIEEPLTAVGLTGFERLSPRSLGEAGLKMTIIENN
jgi:hypothetical protein